MSKIFLNNNFKLFKLQSIPSSEPDSSIIDALCYDEFQSNIHIKTLKKKLTNTILVNDLFRTPNSKSQFSASSSSSSLLIPVTSRLYNNGSSTNEKPDFSEVYKNLQVKVKINQFETPTHDLKIGHFRFKLLSIIPVQLFIFMEVKPGVIIMLAKSQPKLLNVVTDYLVNSMGCLIASLPFPDQLMKQILNETVNKVSLDRLSGVELTFSSISTLNNALNSIVITLPNTDISKFITQDNEKSNEDDFTGTLYDHLKNETSIDFHKLSLSKIRCGLFFILSEGKLRFTNEMSFLPDPEDYEDSRPSIWNILLKICDLCT